jgi:hypothetical protein
MLMPVDGEAATVMRATDEVLAAEGGRKHELIIGGDASTDITGEILEEANWTS